MENNYNDIKPFQKHRRPQIFSGLILLAAGLLLLAYKMGAPIPAWVFTWQVLLIVIGIFTGIGSRFHNHGSLIMIAVGTIFLIDQTRPDLNFHNYIVPAILISIGIIYILRPKSMFSQKAGKKWRQAQPMSDSPIINPPDKAYSQTAASSTNNYESAEYIEINTVLGGVKKIILSKNFKGGEINSFMGGTEINLLKADIQSPIKLEVNNVFGGTKLIVPSNWDVKNEVSAVFGSIEDKRNINGAVPDAGKTITLKGACVFGGIEVTNY